MTQRRRGRPLHPDILTPAEWRVLEELRKGGTNAEIAVRLGVSPDAVKFHISNMLAKLALDDRHQLAAWRPERDRRRLLGTLALPVSFASLGRPLLWTGVALGGAAVVAVILVVLLVVMGVGEFGATPAGPPVMFGDGTYRVGDDIPPGLYRADAPSETCEWRRLRTLEAATAPADDEDVIGFAEGSTIPFVDIAPTDTFFITQGCGTWVTATPRIAPGEAFGNGVWLVGPEVEPGRYRAAPDAEGCGWVRLVGFTGELLRGDDMHMRKDMTNIGVTHIVDIAERDAGFISEGCGEWTADLTPRITPGQPFDDGTYLVGPEILPGRYRASSATEECEWQRLSAFTGNLWPGGFVALGANPTQDDIADLVGTIGAGDSAIVEIDKSDVGFASWGCGTWALMDDNRQALATFFGDGTHVVGSDIVPGRYRAHDPSECTWQRLGGLTGAFDERLAMGGGEWYRNNYDAEMAPLAIVDIAPSDAGFDTQGCGTWSSDLSPVETQKFEDGTYLVGLELSPGRYQASLWDGCHWIRLGGFSGGDGDRLESERSGAYDDRPPPAVEILPSDVGFFSSRCGTWRLLNAHGGSAAAGPDAPAPVRPRPPAPLYHWFRDGRTFAVGAEVGPGLYRAFPSLAGCSWEVRRGEERVGNSGFGAAIVEILHGDDEFASSGCDGWNNSLIQRVWPGELFEDGTYFVGWEVGPGRYRASQPDTCSWVRLPSFRGFPAGSEAPVQHGGTVEIADSDAVFASEGCGTWTPVK